MVEMTVEREGQLLRPVRVRRGAATVSRGGSESFQSYEQVPFYLSSEDRKIAQEEAAARVQRLRNQMRNVAFPVYQSSTSATPAPRSPPSASASPPKASSASPQSQQQQQQQPDAGMMHRIDPQVLANKSNAAAIAQGQQRQGQQQQQQQQSVHGVETAMVYSDAKRQEELRLLHEKQEKQQQQLLELQQQQQQKQKHLEMMKMQEANAASAQFQHQQITLKASAPPLPPSPASAPGFAQPQSPPPSASANAPRSPLVQDAGVMPNTSTGGAGASPPAHSTAPSGSTSPSIGSTSSLSPPQHNSQAMSQAMGTPASVMTTAERQHQRLGTQI
jgi:hypothetical protein